MTPACTYLKKIKTSYSIHEYHHDPDCTSFGLEAASKLGLEPASVFKTLLVTDEKNFFVAVIPVTHTLNLKKAASAFSVKKVRMAQPAEAERVTGYLVGGISPIAQRKGCLTRVDLSARSQAKIYVSGGKRGLDIGLQPDDLIKASHRAEYSDLTD